ncbi:MAG: tetratricopeptide repeat protein, partial [Acetobacteraceae bacterium]|nr:tetratricopeptide repeat protein [Acetobacteraceae bacterium]
VPVDWAMTQMNLGNALLRLGERESGTKRLEEAVAAYRAALEERPREQLPLDWAITHGTLAMVWRLLACARVERRVLRRQWRPGMLDCRRWPRSARPSACD